MNSGIPSRARKDLRTYSTGPSDEWLFKAAVYGRWVALAGSSRTDLHADIEENQVADQVYEIYIGLWTMQTNQRLHREESDSDHNKGKCFGLRPLTGQDVVGPNYADVLQAEA